MILATTVQNQVHDLLVTGDLTINGAMTTTTSNAVALGDSIITLNADFTTGTPTDAQDCGLEVERGSKANAKLLWDESHQIWKASGASISLNASHINTSRLEGYNIECPVTFAHDNDTSERQ